MKINDVNEQNRKLYQRYDNELKKLKVEIYNHTNQLIDEVNGKFNKIEINTIREIEKLKNKYDYISCFDSTIKIFSATIIVSFIIAFFIVYFTGKIKGINALIVETLISIVLIIVCIISNYIKNKYKNKLKGIIK